MEVKTHIVSKDFDGFTLMKWFRKNKTGHTHSLIQKLIRKKAIKVNGKNCKGNSELKTGDEITIPAKSIKKPKNKDQEIKVPTKEQVQKLFTNRVIFEDDNLIAINKEQGVAVQGGTGIEISVDDIIKHISLQKGEFYHIVHRLDKDTSGILLIAKHREASIILGKGFKEKLIDKTYLALVSGDVEKQKGRIALPISSRRSAGGAEKMTIDSQKGKISVTEYKVIKKISDKATLLEINPKTGRKHQIRVHLAHLKIPIVGDGKYGGTNSFIEGMPKTLCLHAYKLSHKEGYFPEITCKIEDSSFGSKI